MNNNKIQDYIRYGIFDSSLKNAIDTYNLEMVNLILANKVAKESGIEEFFSLPPIEYVNDLIKNHPANKEEYEKIIMTLQENGFTK